MFFQLKFFLVEFHFTSFFLSSFDNNLPLSLFQQQQQQQQQQQTVDSFISFPSVVPVLKTSKSLPGSRRNSFSKEDLEAGMEAPFGTQSLLTSLLGTTQSQPQNGHHSPQSSSSSPSAQPQH
jgi:hypothetical protein